MPKVKRKLHPSPGATLDGSAYRHGIRQADEVMGKEGIDIRPDNWQQVAQEWYAPHEPDTSALVHYMTEHQDQLGVTWARELVRMEVFLKVQDHPIIVAHYERVFRRYPRCALVEMWVAGHLMRYTSDFWRAREMYQYARSEQPDFAKPYYELGFMNYLFGDFAGALELFNQAEARVAEDDIELSARIFYNRGIVRYAAGEDKKVAIADLERALKLKPDYAQAKETLRAEPSRKVGECGAVAMKPSGAERQICEHTSV